MGQNAQSGRAPRGLISIDWLLLAVATMVLVFCLGAFVRVANETQIPNMRAGVMTLGTDDDLLAFQDFSFGAQGWSPEERTDRVAGLGAVLGPFSVAEVSRSFQIPVGARTVLVHFDVHILGQWRSEDHLEVLIGNADTLRLSLAETIDGSGIRTDFSDAPNLDLDARGGTITPRPTEPALPGTQSAPIHSLRLAIRLAEPPETMTLQFVSDLADGRSWTLDNLSVIAVAGNAS